MKFFLILFLCISLCFPLPVRAENTTEESIEKNSDSTTTINISAPSALLMEAQTGQIIYEKDADTRRPPASVTKIMTMLLIFEALEEGKIHLEDTVATSEYAASMGGSQVFLEPGEIQTVDTLIKCIAVSSANDACVVMAEYISGSETEFVSQMNKKAKQLGMANTHFENCNGLDAEGHLTTARDIAIMSRELIQKHPQIRDYCMIWQENITHKTKKGSTEFGLSNTNKLVRHYEYATGLKTGSTSQAKFCISATAEKNDIELIAVIMAADDSKLRNKDAITLLSHGFGKCNLYKEDTVLEIAPALVTKGEMDYVSVKQETPFSYVDIAGNNLNQIDRKVEIKKLNAPITSGDKVGTVHYYLDGKEIGIINIVATENVDELHYLSALQKLMEQFFTL